MVNKKHNAIKLANSIDLSNVDNIIATGGGASQLDRDVLVKTFKTIGSSGETEWGTGLIKDIPYKLHSKK